MSLPYCNNLRKDDRVIHVDTKRPGTVASQPREKSVMVSVLWQGTTAPQYVDVLKLRLVCANGQIDEHPPIDGEPPPRPAREMHPAPSVAAAPAGALDALKNERAGVVAEMKHCEDRFKELKGQRDRLDHAIAVLTAPRTG
jgi:hypothetical protein